MEDRISVSLFQRQSNGVTPTAAGLHLLGRSRRILDDVDTLLRVAANSGTGVAGQVCVGAVASISGGKIRQFLGIFRDLFPDVELQIVEGTARDHAGEVRALRMDAAFVVGSAEFPGCDLLRLWSEPLFLAVWNEHRLADRSAVEWSDLSEERFLVRRFGAGPDLEDVVVTHLSLLGRRPVIEQRSVSRDGLMGMVGLNLGVSLVGLAETELAFHDVVFLPVIGESLPFSLVWAARNDNPAFRRFLSLARTHVGSA